MVMKILIICLIKESQISRGHNYTLVKEQSRLYVTKYSITNNTINVGQCNTLSSDCVHASNVNNYVQEQDRQIS